MKSLSPRSRKLLIGAMAVLIVIGTVAFFTREHEPEYNGKPLSYWLRTMNGRDRGQQLPDGAGKRSREALQAIGTNALPFLINWLDWKPGPLQRYIKSQEKAMSATVRSNRFVQAFFDDYYRDRYLESGFYALGALAAPAVPEIRARIFNPEQRERIQRHCLTLAVIGEPALPVYLEVLANPNLDEPIYNHMINSMRFHEVNDKQLFPILLSNVQHTNNGIVRCTFDVLSQRRLKIEPTEMWPFLSNNLHHTNLQIRRDVITMIGFYGEDSFLPYLTNMLSHTNDTIRERARTSLRVIKDGTKENRLRDLRMDTIY